MFPNLFHFLDSWVVSKKEKSIPLVGPKQTPPKFFKIGTKNN